VSDDELLKAANEELARLLKDGNPFDGSDWQIVQVLRRFADLAAERDKLQKFKDYVHRRLDDAGVTVDPESGHKAEGCRIGGRLDEVFAERDDLTAALTALVAALDGAQADVAFAVGVAKRVLARVSDSHTTEGQRHGQ
jgi:hypothetical protein